MEREALSAQWEWLECREALSSEGLGILGKLGILEELGILEGIIGDIVFVPNGANGERGIVEGGTRDSRKSRRTRDSRKHYRGRYYCPEWGEWREGFVGTMGMVRM